MMHVYLVHMTESGTVNLIYNPKEKLVSYKMFNAAKTDSREDTCKLGELEQSLHNYSEELKIQIEPKHVVKGLRKKIRMILKERKNIVSA